MLEKMLVKGRDFDDDAWEDPSLSGWLMRYCIWMLLSIVMGVSGVYQLPYAPGWAKALGYLAYLLPLYSVVGVMMRFRDAVAASLVSLLIFILTGIVNCAVFIVSREIDAAVAVAIFCVAVNVCWMAYFIKSHLVSVRFPENERWVFAFDWILFVFSIGICVLLNITALGNLENYRMNSSEEYRETMEEARKMIGMNDHGVRFVDCRIDRNYCIVYFTTDEENVSEEKFDSILNQPYFSDVLLFDMDKTAPDFIKSAIGDGLILVCTVFRKNVNDGVSFKITPDQIQNLKGPEPLPDLTAEEMEALRKIIGGMIPPSKIKGVRMKSLEWLNEMVLLVNFEVDEGKTQYVDAYGSFQAYAEEMKALLMMNRGQAALDALWSRNMSIKFLLKGARTGYSQEIQVF